MALAREALNIVFREQRGCLQSFETDEMGRLLAADRICRRLYGDVARIISVTLAILFSAIDPLFSRAALKLLALAPEYVAVKYRGISPDYYPRPGCNSHHNEVVRRFREAIFDRMRACSFERRMRARRLITDFKTDTLNGSPEGSNAVDLRVALIAKFEHILPELRDCWDTTAANSGAALRECTIILNSIV